MQINIMVQSFRGGSTCVQVNVNPTDSVNKVLGQYMTKDLGTKIPDYLERALFFGPDIDPEDRRTFDRSCVLDGDTVHAVLRIRTVNVNIVNVHTGETVVLCTLMSCSVRKLKKLFREKQSPSKRIPVKNIMLKLGDVVLDDEQILAHYGINSYERVSMCVQYNINILIPVQFARREKIVAEPHFTILDIKKKVESLGHCTQLYRPALRASVRSVRATHLYMYLDLFPSPDDDNTSMQVFVDEFNDERSVNKFRFSVASDSKIEGIYNEIEAAGKGKNKDRSVNDDVEWPPCHTFNRSWVRTFFPRIETESCSLFERGALNLFFFCFKSKKCQIFNIASNDAISKVKASICESNGLSAKRIWCLPKRILLDRCNWYAYGGVFQDEKNRILLQKRFDFRIGTMTIYIKWATSDTPVQIEVDPGEAVYSVKDKIEHHLGVPICMQILIFKDRKLQDKDILRDLEIVKNSVLHLCLDYMLSEYNMINDNQDWNSLDEIIV